MKKHPDILWLVIDCARYDHISSNGYGKVTTPNIDKLSQISTKYNNAFSTAGWTLPSVTSMFTGLFPHNHNTHNENTKYVLENQTIAQILSDKGYETHCLATNDWVSMATDTTRGFDIVHDFHSNKLSKAISKSLDLLKIIEMDKGTETISNKIIEAFLKERTEKNLFMFALFPDTHLPYRYPSRFHSDFLTKDLEPIKNKIPSPREHFSGRHVLSEELKKVYEAMYDGSLKYVDYCIGKIIDNIKSANKMDDLMLIITADHGENLGENGLMDHYYTLNDNLIHVPLIIKYPNQRSSEEIEDLVQLNDIFPTIMEIINYQPKKEIDGVLLPPNEGFISRDYILAERFRDLERGVSKTEKVVNLESIKFYEENRRIVIRDHKYRFNWIENGEHELFKIEDKLEKNNIFHISKISKKYLKIVENIISSNYSGIMSGSAKFDDMAINRLRMLGYID